MRIRSLEDNAAALTELFLKGSTLGDLVVNFIMIAILPAIGEEFLFRGVIQRLFAEWTKSVHWGVVIAAFLFSFIHFQFYGFVPRFLLGLYFGYLLVWSSSIWLPVLGHLVNNGIAVVVYHFAKQPAGSTTLDTLGTPESGFYTLYISVFLTCGLIGLIYLHTRQKAAS
jgi:membrane protease YdiL (CAAX protease family)